MADEKRFLSQLVSISALSERTFVIPTYQRPYVWGVEQIEKLLYDAMQAYLVYPESPYFIGTVLTEQRGKAFELIDGQQRFTTLWMVAAILHELKVETEMIGFLRLGKSLRIDFEIRREVREYFELLADFPAEAASRYSKDDIKGKPYLKHITAGLATIRVWLQERAKDKQGIGLDLAAFGDFLFTHLIMVENLAPINIDLNKLFATINSSGIQLEQSDIVKAKLLHGIPERVRYGKIWEACENMDDYFERNIRKIFQHTDWSRVGLQDLSGFLPGVYRYSDDGDDKGNALEATIESIFMGTVVADDIDRGPEREQHNGYCRSIIPFSQLLIHAYRIYLYRKGDKDFGQSFNATRLIQIFDGLAGSSEEEIRVFLELLWAVRFTFDKYIIKWTADLDSKQEYLELSRLGKNEKHYFGRTIMDKSASQMLQSVLYFTGDYLRQYWLTPFLHHLMDFPVDTGPGSARVVALLESIDNALSLSTDSGRETSFGLMANIENKAFSMDKYLERPLGTGFYRYWFQKLEYVLWKTWEDRTESRFKVFRITSKNSIEHIFPQKPEYREPMEKESLDSFGNLVLLNVSQNSEYGRKQVNVKRAEFEGKRTFDSLKSQVIFSGYDHGESWDEEKILQHRNKMIRLLQAHYRGELSPPANVSLSLEPIDDDETSGLQD